MTQVNRQNTLWSLDQVLKMCGLFINLSTFLRNFDTNRVLWRSRFLYQYSMYANKFVFVASIKRFSEVYQKP